MSDLVGYPEDGLNLFTFLFDRGLRKLLPAGNQRARLGRRDHENYRISRHRMER